MHFDFCMQFIVSIFRHEDRFWVEGAKLVIFKLFILFVVDGYIINVTTCCSSPKRSRTVPFEHWLP